MTSRYLLSRGAVHNSVVDTAVKDDDVGQASMRVQMLHGLTLATNFDLHQRRPTDGSEPDVRVTLRPPADRITDAPAGDVMLDFRQADDHWYTLSRTENGYAFRVYGLGDFSISRDLRDVDLSLIKGVDPEMAPIMVVGTLAALQLYLRGSLVLHASAVKAPDAGAIAFMGHSGMGKSTLAALFCADGARLLSDDVVGLDGTRPVTVHPGATELRLRPGTGLPEDRLRDVDTRRSADDRQVVQAGTADDESVPLSAILIPMPNRTGRLEMERLPGVGALVSLLGFPRLMGWRDPEVLSRCMAIAKVVATDVPVYRAHVPWGPPFEPSLGTRLMSELLHQEH